MRKLIISLVCVALVCAGIAGYILQMKTAPKAKKKKPPKMTALAKTVLLKQTTEKVILRATGTVVPAEEIMLRSRVAGEIKALNPEFIDGGFLKKGTKAVQIDPTDYELALAQAEATRESAKYELALEMGHQEVAKRE